MSTELEYHDHVAHYRLDGEFYDFFHPDKYMAVEIRRRYQEFVRLRPPRADDAVLEIGSGGGFAAPVLAPFSARYFPVDLARENLRRIREGAPLPVFPATADAYRLPFRDDAFDLVYLSEVVEHLQNPVAALREARRVIKPEGAVLVSVPHDEKITFQICIHCNRPTPTHSHLHSFREDSLARAIRDAGLLPGPPHVHLNLVSNRLRLNYLSRNVPFPLWRAMDRLFNRLTHKPSKLIIVARKDAGA